MRKEEINSDNPQGQAVMLLRMLDVENLVVSKISDWGTQLHCPVCGSYYVHFREPVYKNSDDYKDWQGRGSAIRIPMFCEDGHEWDLRIGFHKGYSFMAIENVFQNKP